MKKKSKTVAEVETPRTPTSFAEFLWEASQGTSLLKISGWEPGKVRPLKVNGAAITIKKFQDLFSAAISSGSIQHPDLSIHALSVFNHSVFEAGVAECAAAHYKKEAPASILPPGMEDMTLLLDLEQTEESKKFLLATKDRRITDIAGSTYIRLSGKKAEQAYSEAKKVFLRYSPRAPLGAAVTELNGFEVETYNSYVPPQWESVDESTVPKSLPQDFAKLLLHLFPLEEEREYFLNWLYASMFNRSLVYLILCGAPGIGKNTLKIVMKALHGEHNTVDGKKNTLTGNFNSQLLNSTLTWFDELSYNSEMENTMKEIQNITIPIERKNRDTTRATRIYTSCVISNNKPRDNYIAFDARKFAPLVMTTKRLEKSLSTREINEMVSKCDIGADTFDVKYVAQIAYWVKRNGWTGKWPLLEYRGPMFYMLAHTSMTRWQKKAATWVLEATPTMSSVTPIYDSTKGYKWGELLKFHTKKNPTRENNFPDNSSVRAFFDVFLDGRGNKGFITTPVPKDIMGDFYVRAIDGIYIHTESESTEKLFEVASEPSNKKTLSDVRKEREGKDAKTKKKNFSKEPKAEDIL